jgi:DNA-binding response OmpR family regulator
MDKMAKAAKILVVDDEKAICQNVEKILKKSDFEVVKAMNAKEALEKMTNESFSLLISDIVMPETNGLQLLKMVKKQWPLTKVLMMTAYASIDTAVKAIRLGALDYVPKPFTPDELRSSVERALSGELKEADSTEKERKYIELVDVDIPFDRATVAETTGEAYARTLGPSDMPIIEAPAPETLENYCLVGERVCEIFKKLGATCKGGVKTSECPQKKARAKKAAGRQKGFDAKTFIGIDQPFSYKEVASLTGPEYIRNLQQDGFSYVPYEELKERVAAMLEEKEQPPAFVNDVLVIDDEVAVNNNIRKILSKKGFEVDQATSREEALEKIAENAYRLVLLDLKIPGVKGLELMKAIRETRPETMVIIITGYASIETAVETARLGAVDYLPKPFTPAEVREVAENALRLAA